MKFIVSILALASLLLASCRSNPNVNQAPMQGGGMVVPTK